MERTSFNQITKTLKKSFEKWDYNRAIQLSDSEAATRDYLIEPFLNILGYVKMDDYSHEFSLPLAKGKVKKIDMVINLNGKNPTILIECKKAGANLTSANFIQLKEYFSAQASSKLGVLTNGLVYRFYSSSLDDKRTLNSVPFLTFDLTDFNSSDIDNLVPFYRNSIDLKSILEEAEGQYFLERFDDGLYKTLVSPPRDFVKSVFSNMGGKVLTEKNHTRIFELINSISISDALERVKINEANNSKTGTVTTAAEIKCFNIIKTIIGMSSKVKTTDLDRISFQDKKGHFNIIVDGSIRNSVCKLVLSDKGNVIEIEGVKFEIEKVSTQEIIKHKTALINSVCKLLY
jgi:hypothetical protein|tara:strand:- start:51 stop:1088 length:1038 start_codon:yes stop_codon:yes gene_type:complete